MPQHHQEHHTPKQRDQQQPYQWFVGIDWSPQAHHMRINGVRHL